MEVVISLISHAVVFVAGVFFDRHILRHLIADGKKIKFSPGELIRVAVLLTIFVIYSVALIQSQFYAGEQPTIALTLIGIFSFGSLVGERDFFVKVLSNFIKK